MAQEVYPGITVDPRVQSGRPCFAGTRTPIAAVLGVLAGGSSFEEVKRGFLVSEEQIRTALGYAAERLDTPVSPASDVRVVP
jgi:uncharacterized protein (DUF433 family)